MNWTLNGQSTSDSEINWLSVDGEKYTIVNVYKPSSTRLQMTDLPAFAHSCLYAGDFNMSHVDWGSLPVTHIQLSTATIPYKRLF